jgi:acyl-CoA reductase-like NAD-dependent aldehyde dehydrogenase
VPLGDAEDADHAITAARRAFDGGTWSGMTPRQRGQILLKAADLLRGRVGESGYGRENGSGSLDTYLRTKSVVLNLA